MKGLRMDVAEDSGSVEMAAGPVEPEQVDFGHLLAGWEH